MRLAEKTRSPAMNYGRAKLRIHPLDGWGVRLGSRVSRPEQHGSGHRAGFAADAVPEARLPYRVGASGGFATPQRFVVARTNDLLLAIIEKGLHSLPAAEIERLVAHCVG
jgi:hypothetical protein